MHNALDRFHRRGETQCLGEDVSCRVLSREDLQKLTTHVNSIREEVRSVGNENYQTALDLGISSYVREFEQKTGCEADGNADYHAAEEDR